MFSMFFGAGNIVFPLALGQLAQDQFLFAILGLLLTAVLVPMVGVTTMTLYDGNYNTFFSRIGRLPGFLVAIFVMALIGPFGATPRCVTVAYSTLELLWPNLSFVLYNAIACALILAFTYSQKRLLEVLGYVLTPVLLGSLILILLTGLLTGPTAPPGNVDALQSFLHGVIEGYSTMDLLGAFFFSSVVLTCLHKELKEDEVRDKKLVIRMALKAGFVGASLLALVYISFCALSARYAGELVGVPPEMLLGTLAMKTLGAYGGLVGCIAVVLACLTTAIALAAVFAQFLCDDLCGGKLNYHVGLAITMLITFAMALLRFDGLSSALKPILGVIYPALIALTVLNLLYALIGFRPIKLPLLIILGLSLGSYLV